MTTADTLNALARCWLSGEDCGPELHDALEEAGWPVYWWRTGRAQVYRLRIRGVLFGVATVGWIFWQKRWFWNVWGREGWVDGHGETELEAAKTAAKTAAEAALRRALAGG